MSSPGIAPGATSTATMTTPPLSERARTTFTGLRFLPFSVQYFLLVHHMTHALLETTLVVGGVNAAVWPSQHPDRT